MTEVTYLFSNKDEIIKHLIWYQARRWSDSQFHPRYDCDYSKAEQSGRIKSVDFCLALILFNAQVQWVFKEYPNENKLLFPELERVFRNKKDGSRYNQVSNYGPINLSFKLDEVKGFDCEESGRIIALLEKSFLDVLMLSESDVDYYVRSDFVVENYIKGITDKIDWKASAELYYPKEEKNDKKKKVAEK